MTVQLTDQGGDESCGGRWLRHSRRACVRISRATEPATTTLRAHTSEPKHHLGHLKMGHAVNNNPWPLQWNTSQTNEGCYGYNVYLWTYGRWWLLRLWLMIILVVSHAYCGYWEQRGCRGHLEVNHHYSCCVCKGCPQQTRMCHSEGSLYDGLPSDSFESCVPVVASPNHYL